MRSSGVLMHISSLSSPFGIGTMGKEAREFVDFLDSLIGRSFRYVRQATVIRHTSPIRLSPAIPISSIWIFWKKKGILKKPNMRTLIGKAHRIR